MIKSRPWAYIYVDKKKSTRVTSARPMLLSAGRHKIELVNPALGLNKVIEVVISPGETVKRFVNLKD